MRFELSELQSGFAAELSGLDLSVAADPSLVAEIKSVACLYPVIVFREQDIDDEQQLAFSQNFGPLETSLSGAMKSRGKSRVHPKVSDISNIDAENQLLPADHRRRMTHYGNLLWHTDSSFKPVPAKYSFLCAKLLPKSGGETEFADMRAAYDALTESMKSNVEPLVAEHSIFYSRALIGFSNYTDDDRALAPPVLQTLTRVLPETGRKCLYLASHASHIVGLAVPEGRTLLRELTEHATRPQFVYQHHWKKGDLVMWDNRCTMHRGRPYDPLEKRDMRRTTVQDVASTIDQRSMLQLQPPDRAA